MAGARDDKLREGPNFLLKALGYFRDPKVALWRKLMGIGAAAYVLSPIDLVPDGLPLVGWLDDLGVLSALALFWVREIRRHARAKQEGPTPPAR